MTNEERKKLRTQIEREISQIKARIWEIQKVMSKYKADPRLDEFMSRDIEGWRAALLPLQKQHTELGGKKYA